MAGLFKRLCTLLLLIGSVQAQQILPSTTPTSSLVSESSRRVSSSSLSVRPTSTLNSNTTRIFGNLGSVASVLQTALPSTSTTSELPLETSSPLPSRPPTLDTRIDATFGILGGVLIISGLAIGSVGTYYRRPPLFVSGLYTGSLVVGLLIVHFALVGRQSPPKSTTRGLFLLASLVAGIVCGAFSFLFHKAGELLQASLAGFLLGCSLLAVQSDSLIKPVGLRYILLLGLSALFFLLASIPRLSLIVVVVATSAIGATATVIGIDCFTTAGLKEFYVYNFGFSKLYPKLEGHYPLSNPIVIELGVLLALFICMMAFQHRFYVLMGKKQQTEQENDQERTVRNDKIDDRARRHNEAQIGDWEEKYGNGRPARRGVSESEVETIRKGKRKNWFGFGKSRKASKGDASLSSSMEASRSKSTLGKAVNPSSTDFLPRLDVEFGQLRSVSSPATTTLGSLRPVLSPLQASPRPLSYSKKEGWDDYLSTRQVAMSMPANALPTRSRSSLALVSPSPSIPKSSPRFQDEADEDDDTPLALSPRRPTSYRTNSSPLIGTSLRPTSSHDLHLTPSNPESSSLPRSHSRALSIAHQIPSVLLESPSKPSLAAHIKSESQPGMLDKVGKRATLLDLNEPSKFNPYNERERPRTASDERIIIGDRRKSFNGLASPKKVNEGPKIMDFEDLDAKHRKRLSLLQTTAADNVAAEAAKAEIVRRQQVEAASHRSKDHTRRRSLSSNNLLSSPRTSTDEFGQLGGGGNRPKSIASLSGLLSLKRNSSSGDLLTDETLPRSTSRGSVNTLTSPTPRTRPNPSPRRESAQTFQRNSLALPPHDTRRHSLTTLLETSFDDAHSLADLAALQRPAMKGRSHSGGLEKVTEWRRSGTFSLNHLPPPTQAQSAPITPPAAVLASPTKKGKASWLDY